MMLRISHPGHLAFIDLGPGAASAGGVRGTFVVPEREVPADPKVVARKERDRANHRAWRAANIERVRAYDRARKGRV